MLCVFFSFIFYLQKICILQHLTMCRSFILMFYIFFLLSAGFLWMSFLFCQLCPILCISLYDYEKGKNWCFFSFISACYFSSFSFIFFHFFHFLHYLISKACHLFSDSSLKVELL